jgi:UDP-3-O-[3-hydroxymyristoyl] glucosamine N-acyltransferase
LSDLCQTLTANGFNARLEGEDRIIRACNTLEDATDGELSFLSNPKYQAALSRTKAAAVIVKDDVPTPPGLSAVRCNDPYAGITVAIIAIHGHRKHPTWHISPGARIDPSAHIGENPNIAGGATIAANVRIGDNCTIYPGCYIADGVTIGHDCTLFPNVVIYDHCVLGHRVTIHAGSVIGQDGLGYAPHNDKWVKIPQIGRTVLGDDVEIGANCAIDRATLGTTEIGSGTKFGNVVVIGHGTKIGPDCLFVGQVGVAGSVTVGRHVTLAGQVGVSGHISIGDNARAGAQSGIAGSIPPGEDVLGSPALPIENARRSLAAVSKLPDWLKRVRDLEREVKDLREKLNGT